jgi:hypothetical protein
VLLAYRLMAMLAAPPPNSGDRPTETILGRFCLITQYPRCDFAQ